MPVRPARAVQLMLWCLPALLVCCGHVFAQQLVVGAGASLVLGDGHVDAGCRDLRIDGALDIGAGGLDAVRDLNATGPVRGGSGTVQMSGDLAAPALLPQDGTFEIGDGCGRSQSTVSGAHSFNHLRLLSTGGHSVLLPAGVTQSVLTGLELLGSANAALDLRSNVPGAVAFIRLAIDGSQLVDRISVRDVGAPVDGAYIAPNLPAFYRSVDLGNSPRFFAENEVPIPALSARGLALLGLLVCIVASLSRRLRPRGDI